MSRRLRVAVVGAGYFSRFHHDGWARIPGVELVANCDADQAKAEAMAREFGCPRSFSDAAQMIDAVAPDLLDIATPPVTHAELCRLAVDRGIPAICQKAFCTTLAEARRTVEHAEMRGVQLVVHENFRFQPWFREIRRIIDDGKLGDIFQVAFRLRPGDGQGREAYLSRQPYFQKMPRFLIHETGIHFIDTFRYLLGEVTGVFARLERLNPVISGEDSGHILFEFRGGRRGHFDGNRLVDHVADDRRLTMGETLLEGSRGVLRLDGHGRIWLRTFGENTELEWAYDWQRVGFAGDCVRRLQAHVVAHFVDGAPLENSGREYLRNLVIEEAVYSSNERGSFQAVPIGR